MTTKPSTERLTQPSPLDNACLQARPAVSWPKTINVDGYRATQLSLKWLAKNDVRWNTVHVRTNRYINNLIEQDHRAVKGRCAAMLGLKSSATAAVTLASIELAHRIRKSQYAVSGVEGESNLSLRDLWHRALAKTDGEGLTPMAPKPPMHQNSIAVFHRYPAKSRRRQPRRFPVKASFGHNLSLLVMPNGARIWRMRYQFRGRRSSLRLGAYPDTSMGDAQARHEAARSPIAAGVDPIDRRKGLRRTVATSS